ncbi:MAG: hypothetical protein IPK72_11180 [Candidatus Eisenbacteria bacterium]|nr:hypothetical protein [Candidatus Eisenbacteria bacterium]
MRILRLMSHWVCTSARVRRALALVLALSAASAPVGTEAASTYRFGAQGIALGDTLAIQAAPRLRLEIGQRHSSVSREVARPGDTWHLIPDGLEVDTAKPMLSFPQPNIVRVDVPHGRSTLRGALIGATVLGIAPAIGTILFARSVNASEDSGLGLASLLLLSVYVGIPVGTGAGAIVGYNIVHWRAAYEAR